MQVINPGYEGLQGAMIQKFMQDRMAKYISLRQLFGYSISMFAGPLYARFFDAKATTYFYMAMPVFLSVALRLVELIVWFHPQRGAFRYMDMLLEALTEERLRVNAEPAAEKPGDAKKTD